MRQFRKSLTNCIGRYFSRCRFVKRRFFKNNRMILNCSFDVVQVIALFMTVEFIASFNLYSLLHCLDLYNLLRCIILKNHVNTKYDT